MLKVDLECTLHARSLECALYDPFERSVLRRSSARPRRHLRRLLQIVASRRAGLARWYVLRDDRRLSERHELRPGHPAVRRRRRRLRCRRRWERLHGEHRVRPEQLRRVRQRLPDQLLVRPRCVRPARRNLQPRLPVPQTCCTFGCTDTTSDPGNCGGCGFVCASGAFCSNSQCVSNPPPPGCGTVGCAPGYTCCGTFCADTTDDVNNCGGCGLECPPQADQCVNGQCCTAQTCGPPVCNCSVGQTCCPSGCATTSNDPNNCGGCGLVCPNGGPCVNSACTTSCAGGPACTGGESCCSTGCSDVLTDPLNCGACGAACTPGQSCVAGSCQSLCGGDGGTQCAAGQTCCPAGCASTQTDPANCGGCNIQCGATATCVDGSCVANEGAFDPIVNPTYLSPGVHSYTTINVPAGVTVYVGGAGALSGTLDLHATGAIEIDGTIDVSGGPGTQNTITSQSTESGRAGGGGFTGEPYQTAALSAACQFVRGQPGLARLRGLRLGRDVHRRFDDDLQHDRLAELRGLRGPSRGLRRGRRSLHRLSRVRERRWRSRGRGARARSAQRTRGSPTAAAHRAEAAPSTGTAAPVAALRTTATAGALGQTQCTGVRRGCPRGLRWRGGRRKHRPDGGRPTSP